jgi:hypothetical protein
MSISSLFVLTNSLRLRAFRPSITVASREQENDSGIQQALPMPAE